MNKPYSTHGQPGSASWRWLALLLLGLLLGGPAAQAQSGPYGNEWIVQGQPYYKVKVWRDGLYRLDFAYLSKLGAGAVAPSQLQVWRRGKEVAVYQGGNSATLDNSSYLEFYGQRNDAFLDRDLYKNLRDQGNPHYSFYTDTAAYFVTWGSRAGKRMAQPTAAGGAPHGWRLQSSLTQKTATYAENNGVDKVFMPWIEAGEGFYQGWIIGASSSPLDSVLRAVSTAAGAPVPMIESTVVGGSDTDHHTSTAVIPPGSPARVLGVVNYNKFELGRGRFPFALSDISSTGQLEVQFAVVNQKTAPLYDLWRFSWWRVTVPQQNVWFSDRRQLWFQNDSLLGGPATYEVDNIPATVRGYDVQDPWNVQRIEPTAATTLGSTGRRYVFPSATGQQTRRLLLADEARVAVPPAATRVNFRVIDPTKPNFIVITHPKLAGPATTTAGAVPNAVKAYASYRASAAGGRYDTLLVMAPQLYDQFHYGERSLLAMRHFALWMVANAPATQTKYLLLLGKGISPGSAVTVTNSSDFDPGFGVNATVSPRYQGENGLDLVPVSTRSPSDNFMTSDWRNGHYAPALPTGRVVASTPQQVADYLNKLTDYESQLSPTQPNPEDWHKKFVHLVGGHDANDFYQFGSYMDRYKQRIESPLEGGKVTTYRRTTTGTQNSFPITINISPDVNIGVAGIRYFGHGSTTQFDINLGDITDPGQGYTNLHKYPIMTYNGCFAGAAFFNTRTTATDWILVPNKGAIGFMAESGLSFAVQLDAAQDTLDRLTFNTARWFGRPLAEIHREAVQRLEKTSLFDPIYYPSAVEQLLCTVWQGDPALAYYAPAKPDLIASNAALSLSPIAPDQAVTASSTQFILNVGVSNPLRITRDSVEIRVTRTSPNGGTQTYLYNKLNGLRFPQAFQRDTVYTITLTNPAGVDIFGDNVFKVELDYANKIAEQDETNNVATLHYSFLKGGVTVLAPVEFGITASNRPRLVAQTNDAKGPVRGFDFQLDSVATFDSRGGQPLQSTTVQAAVVASWTPAALLPAAGRDSVVWYWRVRFSAPVKDEDTDWRVSSFRVIPGALSGGWSQSRSGQFRRDQLQNVTVSTPGNHWSFPDRQTPIRLLTAGGGGVGSAPTFGTANGFGILTDITAPPYTTNCGINAPNLLVVVLDPNSLQRITVPGTYATCGVNGQTFYHFGANPASAADTLDNLNNSAVRRTELLTFLQNIPDGSLVALISENRLRYAEPSFAAVKQQLAKVLGSVVLGQLRNGEPWAIVAKKRAVGGQLLAENGPDRTTGTATYSQRIALNYSISTPGQAGVVTSTLIGPAQQWGTLYNTVRHETTTAKHKLVLSGIDAAGNATVLNPDVPSTAVDLSKYLATTYPYMQLRLVLSDSANRVAPQLKQWLVTYKGLPEGVVRRDLALAKSPTVYDAARLQAQAVSTGHLRFPVKFDNVSQESFTSPLQVQIQVLNAAGTVVPGTSQLLSINRALVANLPTDSVLTVMADINVIGKFGQLTPQVIVNPQKQPELYFFNNELKLDPLTVIDTNVPPSLDVAVDGRHILNGELVSAAPVINIQLRDEDRLRAIADASYFTIYLQKPGQATATLVDVNSAQVHFTVDNTAGSVARLEYQPALNGPLDDGVYTLRVQARDPSGATAGAQEYQVKFEVVKESTISNVYPYPNPVTSKAKFVFTVTGTELPRNMKIQIMTLTGKVVREIFMSELGPLHMGNNITDYAWDGTDQYGDRLANGTYLYRVALDDPNGAFSKRVTAGDQAFKNDWGKLVLLR